MNLITRTCRRFSTVCILSTLAVGLVYQANAQVVTGVQPMTGTVDVPLNSSIVFSFDVPIDPGTLFQTASGGIVPIIGSLHWSSNIDPFLMTPNWSAGNTVLTLTYQGNLPGLAEIGWEINPSSGGGIIQLADLGDSPVANASGSFTTAAGSDCNPDGVPDNFGRLFFSKFLVYKQDSSSSPVLDPEAAPAATLFVQSPAVNAVTSASLKVPGDVVKDLTPLFNQFVLAEEFTDQAEMDAAYPAGGYEVTMTRATSSATMVPMAMPASYPPIPTTSNYGAAQSVDPLADFTLQWNAFADATGNDFIGVLIEDGETTVFEAPDLCVPIELPNSATSIVIPAGTLTAGKVYDVTLSFGRSFYFSTNSPAEFLSTGAIIRGTRFTLNTGGGGVVPKPQLSAPAFSNGLFSFTMTDLQVGTGYRWEYSTTLLPNSWTLLELFDALAATRPVVDNGSSETTGQRFYRVITQ